MLDESNQPTQLPLLISSIPVLYKALILIVFSISHITNISLYPSLFHTFNFKHYSFALLSFIFFQLKSMTTSSVSKIQGLLVLFLLVNTMFIVLEARPLSIMKEVKKGIKEDVDVFDWLSLGSMKQSGPSGPGEGHKFTNSETLGGIKNSGPSPGGEGHKFTNSKIFEDVKDSGPSSPGPGH